MQKVAVVGGGYSSEYEISVNSAAQVLANIDTQKYEPYLVEITRKEWVAIIGSEKIEIDKSDFTFTHNGHKIKFDLVFMVIHGTPGEDGILQSYFALLNIPVTSCSPFVSALTFNKFATKSFLEKYNIPTAKALIVRKNDVVDPEFIVEQLGLPCFIKPNNGGSSFGVSKVKTKDSIQTAIVNALKEDDEIIIESFLNGREFTVGAFKDNGDVKALPVTEIISQNEFFDYKAKYKGESNEVTPAELSIDETGQLQKQVVDIYKYLGCDGVVRIDFIYVNGVFNFIEVNTVPGMSTASIVPQQAVAAGYTLSDFYSLLIEEAICK